MLHDRRRLTIAIHLPLAARIEVQQLVMLANTRFQAAFWNPDSVGLTVFSGSKTTLFANRRLCHIIVGRIKPAPFVGQLFKNFKQYGRREFHTASSTIPPCYFRSWASKSRSSPCDRST